jgi:DNA helicase-2/ATP-dependent DNA helicase PcrA
MSSSSSPNDSPPADPLKYEEADLLRPLGPAPPPPASRMQPATYLDALNVTQREAAEALDGPVLVLAGAGTGKTRVLTTRLAHLLFSGRARPHEILAVTFTNRAAREMRERVGSLIGPASEGLWLGTFHSLAARILRRHAELVGLKSNFTILDTDDQIRLIKQILAAENIDEKRWPARALSAVIQRWKDKGLTPDRVSAADSGDLANGRAIEIYRQYQDRLKTLNAADFGDLLLHCLELFTANPDVVAKYQQLYRYILVDEYQDTNVSQYLWLRLLAQLHKNMCCVGDDDQSIYGWRGAEVGNILRFEKDFPGAKVIRLERNYRSTGHILAAASGLISHNMGRLGKTLWTEIDQGEKVSVRGIWDGEAEARYIGDEIEALQRKKHSLDEIALLVRAGFQTREFEERFITLGIPYRVIGGPRFYEREEIRDAVAYLRVINQPDDDLALERVINKPTRGIGKTTMQAIHGLARALDIPLLVAAGQIVETDELKPAMKRSLAGFLEDIARWWKLAETTAHTELVQIILDESGYTEMWKKSSRPEAPGKLENLKEFITAIEEFENLGGFLEHISLVMENDNQSNVEMVNLITLHSAKGLEFDTVFLPGWEEGLFPHQRAMDESGAAGLEEERRLAYVGLTRARRQVFISFAANRRIYNQWQSAIPSRFVDELPTENIDYESASGLYNGGGYTETRDRPSSVGSKPAALRSGGPGWRRLHAHGTGSSLGESSVEVYDGTGAKFSRGERCFHQKFGMGTVTQVDGDKLSIKFDKAGEKRVVAAFVSKP